MDQFKLTLLIVFSVILLIQTVRIISCELYIHELKNEGYSKDWAYHKALVEYGFRSIDNKYRSIEED